MTDILIFLIGVLVGWSAPQFAVVKRLSAWAEGKLAGVYARFF
jgi:hypothetical protein